MNNLPFEARKRRQVVESCAFCRLRKIRCDRVKPKCGNCRSRHITDCIYTDDSHVQLSRDELFGNKPNVLLLQRISELELTVKSLSSSGSMKRVPQYHTGDCDALRGVTNDRKDTTTLNRLLQFKSTMLEGGGNINQGLTAIPTTFTVRGRRFHEEYQKILQKLTLELERTGKSKKNDITSNPLYYNYGVNLMDAISLDLPSIQIVKDSINSFFDSHLYKYFQVLEKETVMGVYFRCFFCVKEGDDIFTSTLWDPESNELNYNVGIILLILCFIVFKGPVPQSFECLFTILCGLNDANTFVLARAQFILLFCIFKTYRGEGGPGCSHLSSTVSTLCSTCVLLGLNEVQSKSNVSRNIWYWTLFYDLLVSFNLGCPLNVSNIQLDEESLLCNSNEKLAILRNFLYVGRQTMRSLYDRSVDPNLEQLITTLVDFLVRNFPPISLYTNPDSNESFSLFDVIILSPLLAMIVNLYNIRRVIDPQVDMSIKNGFIKFVMLSSSLTVSTIVRCFDADEQNGEIPLGGNEFLPPFLNLSVLMLNYLPIRALMELYGLFFYKITLFEEGLFISTDKITFDLSLQDLDVPSDLLFTFKGVFEKFCSIFDTLWQPKYNDLNASLCKCPFFLWIFGLEKMNRKLIQIGLQKREEIEKHYNVSSLESTDLAADIKRLLTDQTTAGFNETLEHFANHDAYNYLDFLNI